MQAAFGTTLTSVRSPHPDGSGKAGPGWDVTTGLGSPNGEALLTLLSGTTPTTGD